MHFLTQKFGKSCQKVYLCSEKSYQKVCIFSEKSYQKV